MKGDLVTIAVQGLAFSQTIRASKAGRTVVVAKGTRWVTVTEMTAPSKAHPKGRSTGNVLSVRTDVVLSVEETRGEVAALPRKSRKAVPVTVPLGLVADG